MPKPDLSFLSRNWTSEIVSRDAVEEFTGGIINSKTLANLDSKGIGPEGRIRIGRKIAYRVKPFIQWLEDRAEVIAKKRVPNRFRVSKSKR